MARLLLLALAGAAASAAVRPPRIELDLSAMRAAGRAMPPSEGLQEDWTERCPAGAGTNAENCPHPVARAYDHHNVEITVTEKVFLADFDGKRNSAGAPIGPGGVRLPLQLDNGKSAIDYTYRSTYVYKYGARDSAGNIAEEVTFMLVLDDMMPPAVQPCSAAAGAGAAAEVDVLEAGTGQRFCGSSTARDNLDHSVRDASRTTRTMRYTIYRCAEDGEGGALLDGKRCLRKRGATPTLIAKKVSKTKARRALDSKFVGTYEVRLTAWDAAGAYGAGCAWSAAKTGMGNDNCGHAFKLVRVQDTAKPSIVRDGPSVVVHECSKPYVDLGAKVTDVLDTEALHKRVALETDNLPDVTDPGDYTVVYSASDAAGNAADEVTRFVKVRDTRKPTVTLRRAPCLHVQVAGSKCEKPAFGPACTQTDMVHRVTDPGDPCHVAFEDPGADVTDTCDKDVEASVRGKWKGRVPGTPPALGQYTLLYTARDASGNVATAERTVTFVDRQAPKIELKGPRAQESTVEASPDGVYRENGAECHDYVGGDISKHVKVTGDEPDYAVPDTYVVAYNCADASGNAAMTEHRTVHVVDTTPPTIKLMGPSHLELEAGFKYDDKGATASDSLDGDVSGDITIEGEVNQDTAWYGLRTCAEIKSEAAKQGHPVRDGEYHISAPNSRWPNALHSRKWLRVKVWCDMEFGLTYYACRGCKAVKPYDRAKGEQGSCGAAPPDAGVEAVNADPAKHLAHLQMMKWTYPEIRAGAKKKAMAHFAEMSADGSENLFFPNDPDAVTNFYLCSPPRKPTYQRGTSSTPHWAISGEFGRIAEAGKYVLRYGVKDAHGNAARPKFRTIVVKDTLPPVISLHMHRPDGSLSTAFHVSKADQLGIGGDVNPAGSFPENENLHGYRSWMAETAAAAGQRGWLLGAATAAVAGIALLATAQSRRRKGRAAMTLPTVPV